MYEHVWYNVIEYPYPGVVRCVRTCLVQCNRIPLSWCSKMCMNMFGTMEQVFVNVDSLSDSLSQSVPFCSIGMSQTLYLAADIYSLSVFPS